MRTGKTATLLALIASTLPLPSSRKRKADVLQSTQSSSSTPSINKPTLIITSKTAQCIWIEAIKLHLPHAKLGIVSAGWLSENDLNAMQQYDIILLSWSQGWSPDKRSIEFARIIIDEAHEMPNHGCAIYKMIEELSLNTKCRWALSGSPFDDGNESIIKFTKVFVMNNRTSQWQAAVHRACRYMFARKTLDEIILAIEEALDKLFCQLAALIK